MNPKPPNKFYQSSTMIFIGGIVVISKALNFFALLRLLATTRLPLIVPFYPPVSPFSLSLSSFLRSLPNLISWKSLRQAPSALFQVDFRFGDPGIPTPTFLIFPINAVVNPPRGRRSRSHQSVKRYLSLA